MYIPIDASPYFAPTHIVTIQSQRIPRWAFYCSAKMQNCKKDLGVEGSSPEVHLCVISKSYRGSVCRNPTRKLRDFVPFTISEWLTIFQIEHSYVLFTYGAVVSSRLLNSKPYYYCKPCSSWQSCWYTNISRDEPFLRGGSWEPLTLTGLFSTVPLYKRSRVTWPSRARNQSSYPSRARNFDLFFRFFSSHSAYKHKVPHCRWYLPLVHRSNSHQIWQIS